MQSFHAITIIPARGGSLGLNRKNVLSFAGKPLIEHTIQQSKHCRSIEHTFVSTDDDEIADIAAANDAGVIRRPSAISDAVSSSESALYHALGEITSATGQEPDYVVFLQCTSPLRTPEDLEKALKKIDSEKCDSLLSVSPNHRFIWQTNHGHVGSVNYDYRFRPMRQDMANQFAENGAIYIFKPEILRRYGNRLGGKIALYVMESWQSFEVDDMDDFLLCEWLYHRYLTPPAVQREQRVHVLENTLNKPKI